MTTNTVYLDRSDELELAKTAILQAIHRVRIPVNAQVILIRWEDPTYFPGGGSVAAGHEAAAFLDPRRFVLWAVKEGLVPDEYRKECLRYARG